jgi:hypothetical protein
MSEHAPIPREIALQLCTQIREENKKKKLKFLGFQCWGCYKWANGDPDKMCVSSKEGYRGCYMVNKRFDEQNA